MPELETATSGSTLRLQSRLDSFLADAALAEFVRLPKSVLHVHEEVVQGPELLQVDRTRIVSIMYSAYSKKAGISSSAHKLKSPT